jgi:DHA1 family multidrug resistance protein-like MFS transporter
MTGWQRTLWVIFFVQLVSATGFSVMFPFLPLYVHELGTNTGLSLEFWSAMAYSSQAITMMLVSPFWGAVADRYGHKLMLERATFGGAVVLLLMAFAQSAEQLALLRGIQGLITGTIAAANGLVAATAPRERTGYAMGVLQLGLAGGVAIGPLLGGVIADWLGFRATFVVTALSLAVSGLVVWRAVPEVRTAVSGQRRAGLAGWRDILGAPGVALVYGIRFLTGVSQTMLLPVLSLFIVTLLPQPDRVSTMTGLTVGLWSAAGTASAVYLGRLGDRVGHRKVLIACTLLAAIGFVPQMFVTSIGQLLVLQTLAGAAGGGIIPALSALLARLMPPGSAGAVYGVDNSVTSGSRAVAPLIGAGVASLLGLRSIFGVIAFILAAGGLLALLWLPRTEPEQRPRAVEG